MARYILLVVFLAMILSVHVYQVHAGPCGCPSNSDRCEQNCLKKYPFDKVVKGACKGFLYMYCKCSVNGGGWYSIANSC